MSYGLGQKTKSHKLFLILLLLIAGVAALLFVTLASLPTLLSSNWGKKRLIAFFKSSYGVDVQCERFSLRWFGHQEITDLKVIDPKSKTLFTCDIIKTEATLLDILLKKRIGHLYFDRPYLEVYPALFSFFTPALPPIEMHRASLGALSMPAWRLSFPYTGTLNCTYGKISLIAEGIDPIVFDAITANLENSPKENRVSCHLACVTLQKGIEGSIHADASCSGVHTPNPFLKIQAEMTQLPVRGIDELLFVLQPRYRGLLVNALGETANANVQASSSSGNIDIDLTANSPLCTAAVALSTENNMLTLKKPGSFSLNITPNFFASLTALMPERSSLRLTKPGKIQGTINAYSSPLPQKTGDLWQASVDADISSASPLAFEYERTPVLLDSLSLNVNSVNKPGMFHCNANASLTSSDKAARCTAQASVDATTHRASYSVDAVDLPAGLIGTLAGMPSLGDILGPTLTLKAAWKNTGENTLRVSASSPFLTLQEAAFTLDGQCSLQSPVAFTYTLIPETLRKFRDTIALEQPVTAKGRLNTLTFPFEGAFADKMRCDAEIVADSINLKGKIPLALEHFQGQLSIHGLNRMGLSFTSDRAGAQILAKYEPKNDRLTFLQTLNFYAALDNPLLHAFIDTQASLVAPTQFKLSIDPFSCTLKAFSLPATLLKATATLDPCSIVPFAGAPPVALQDIQLPLQWDPKRKTAQLGLSCRVREKEGTAMGSLSLQASLSDLQWDKLENATLNATLDMQQLPSAFLDALGGQALFSTLLGPQFSTALKLQSTKTSQNIGWTLTSPLLNVKGAFVDDGKRLALAGSPLQIQWTLTPAGYAALDKQLAGQQKIKAGFELKEPTVFQLTLSEFSLPLAPKASTSPLDRLPTPNFDLSLLNCVGKGNNPSLFFFDSGSQELFPITDLDFSFNKIQGQAPLSIASSAQIAKTGSISLKATVEQLFDEKGAISWERLSSQIALQIKSFPSRILDLFARLKGRTDYPFSKLLGSSLNASLQAKIQNLSGPLSLNVNSPSMRFSLDGSLQKGTLQLTSPIYAQMKISKEMSTLFLSEVNPLSLSYFYSESPITLEIPAQGFSLPLHPFDKGRMSIPTARIELGKVACRNEGNVNIALGLLKTKQFEKNKEVLLWFAPMDLHIQAGTLNMERTEILLAETFDVALWGKVLLVDNYVDMILGITASALNEAFGIKDLPSDYVITIPIKGPADNVQINSKTATAKIALLLAGQQKDLSNSIKKNPAGAILGGLMQQMSKMPDNERVPPAKHPFPWERGKTGMREVSTEKKRHFKRDEKPLKQILKVLR
jgi:hypothetical protein